MTIRIPEEKDIAALYALGLATPELQVSETDPFMEPDEFRAALAAKRGLCMLAEDEQGIAGFLYANGQDMEKAGADAWACLVYLVVDARRRHQGIASALYDAAVAELKKRGIKKLYGWARDEEGGTAIQDFLRRKGFSQGHRYRWFDTTL